MYLDPAASNVLVAHPKLAADTLAELIELEQRTPGRLNYASTGSGGTPHLTSEWLKHVTGMAITHVPYKGAQAYIATMAGEVSLMFMNRGDALPHLRADHTAGRAGSSTRRGRHAR